jgi:hypothetical protein
MKIILFIFSFVLIALAWATLKAGGAIPQGALKWRWFGEQSLNINMDYRVLGLAFLIALPLLLWLFRKRA